MIVCACLLMLLHLHVGYGDNFPSLLTTNATLAIIIDREYMSDEYEDIKKAIETYLVYAKREILRHGGVNVQYYSWTTINLKREFTAILSVASCTDTWKLFRAAETENLLHMAISESDCLRLPPTQAITVPMIDRGEELPQVLLDLRFIEAYKWSSVIVIYDHTVGRDMVSRLMSSLTAESRDFQITGAAVTLMKLEMDHAHNSAGRRLKIEKLLGSIHNTGKGINYLVVVSKKNMELMMEVAKSLDLVDPLSQWLYLVSDTNWKTGDLSYAAEFIREGNNVAIVNNYTINDARCKGGAQCHAEELLEAFTRALDKAIIEEQDLATTVTDEEWEAIRPTKLERRNALLKSIQNHLVQYGSCDNCTTWRLRAGETWGREYQVNASVAELLQVGYWRPSDGASLTDQLFPHITHGFRGKTLPLVSFHNPPWQILTVNETGQVTSYHGLIFDVIKELARTMNFTYTVYVLGNGKANTSGKGFNEEISDVVTNEVPDAIMEMVRSKKASIAACGFTITDQRKSIINFTIPVATLSYTFLVARPRELSRALLFMSPFTQDAWLCIAAAVLFMGPVLYVFHNLSPVYECKGLTTKGLSSVQSCMWYMYGALLQQGGMHLPYADSARVIVGTWWLIVLVVVTTYCGNLVAFLTFPKMDIPISTVEDILAHRESVTWGVVRGTFLEQHLKTSQEPKYVSLYKGMMVHAHDDLSMISQVEEGKHIYIDWKTKLQFIMKKQFLDNNRCDLALGTDEFLNEQIAMIVTQGMPYLPMINDKIKRLHQVGLIQKWFRDYLPKKDRCFKVGRVAEVNNHTVNMDDMQGSFFVLFLGFVVAILMIAFEKIYHSWRASKEKPVVAPYVS